MKFDELKECTRCGSDACYLQEVNDKITIELCYGCGFSSNSIMLSGSEFLKEQLDVLPELHKELLDEEKEGGKIWMPLTINIEDKGMVFAAGSGRDDWHWAGVKAILIEEDLEDKYKGAKYRADMTTLSRFEERDFMDALSYIGVIPE